MVLYIGNVLGFNYAKECKDDKEFKVWLKAKLLRYLLDPNNPATSVIADILGIKELNNRVNILEETTVKKP